MTEPETKRRKLQSDAENKDVIMDPKVEPLDEKAEIEKLITKMKASQSNLKPVLADELVGSLPVVNVYIGKVLERKLIHKVIVNLNSLLPLPELQHLKRARSVEVLICPSDDTTPDEVTASLKDKGFDLSAHLEDGLEILSVASRPPLLKRQYEAANKVWPCNFHPNSYTERLVSGDFFSKSEVQRHRKYMELAYDVAEIYEGAKDKSDERSDNDIGLVKGGSVEDVAGLTSAESARARLTQLRGVVVVDPDIDSIVAVGYDRRSANPCQHAVMIAIDNVARSQQGGAWKDDSMFAEESSDSSEEELVVEGVPKMFRDILNTSYDGLRFGARRTLRRCESKNANCDVKSVQETVDGNDLVRFESSSVESLASLGEAPCDEASGPYLCTGYDVYTTNEPCVMCSMALVHGRARRVMFALRNRESGALTSVSKLHTVAALNHRYEVFTGFFEEPLT